MNTYNADPARGLSRLQREVLGWLQEVFQKHPAMDWAISHHRPLNLKCMLYHGEKGYFFSGPRDPSFCRAVKSLVKRGLIEKRPRGRSGEREVALRLTSAGRSVDSKLLNSNVYQFQLPLGIKTVTMSEEAGGSSL